MMKLSIWQQFSSNHSAAFSIVAKFESAEKAQEVANKLTNMLLEIYKWKEYLGEWDTNPSLYKLEVEQNLMLGTTWILSEGHIRRAFQVFGNTIFVSDTPGYSDDGSGWAFIEFLTQSGGKVIAAQEVSQESIYMNLSGNAFDEETAQSVMTHIMERERHNTKFYIHDMKDGFYASAGGVRREGKQLFFEGIYFSSFEALGSWYFFAKTHNLTNNANNG